MNLGKQIDSLLKRYSSVYISGLGVFQKVHTSATFDSKRNVFLPPISYIEFDHFGTEGYDFLTYLQQLEQLGRDEAESRLQELVTTITNHIQQDGEFVLEHLGTLVSYGNSFVFKPFDLSGFKHEPIKDDYYQQASTSSIFGSEQQKEDSKIPVPFVGTNSDRDIFGSVNNDQSNMQKGALGKFDQLEADPVSTEKKESNSYIYGLVAAIAILALGGIYYYSTLKPERKLVENLVTIESTPADTNIRDLDTTMLVLVDSIHHEVPNQDTVIESTVKESVKAVKIEDKYAIIIGTHKILDMALEEAKSYNQKGHHSVRVLEPNMSKNLKRVIWDTYPTREKRDSALRVVRKLYKEDAWGTEI